MRFRFLHLGRVGLSTLSAAAALAGCAVPHDLGPGSTLRDTGSLAAGENIGQAALSNAAWPTEAWWRRYGDEQLNALVAEAIAHSPGLHIAQARLRQAAAVAGLAEAAGRPQVNAAAKSTRQLYSENSTVPQPLAGDWDWQNEAAFHFSYELDFWDRNRSAVEAAAGRVRASEVDTHAARLMLVTATMRSYVRLQQGFERLDIAEANLKQRESVLQLTRQRVDAGIDTQLELKQAESLIAATRTQIAQVGEAIALTRTELAALMGKGPDRGLAVSRPRLKTAAAIMLPTDVPADLIGRRPDVVAQRWRVEAASKDIKVARAQFYPNISLTAFAGLQSLGISNLLDPGSRIAGAGPALNLPVFDGGRLRSNLAARHAEYDLAVEQYNATLVDAVRDVVSQLVSLRWLEEQRMQQQRALKASEEAYGLAFERYRSGVGNYLQVLTAEGEMLNGRRLRNDLDIRTLELDIELTRALGGGFRQDT